MNIIIFHTRGVAGRLLRRHRIVSSIGLLDDPSHVHCHVVSDANAREGIGQYLRTHLSVMQAIALLADVISPEPADDTLEIPGERSGCSFISIPNSHVYGLTTGEARRRHQRFDKPQ